MIKIDLITGFLGSGKTTFIRKYVKYLTDKGLKIGILENDYGAVNVDAMLLQDILGESCDLEMVAGGCDADCTEGDLRLNLLPWGCRDLTGFWSSRQVCLTWTNFLILCTKIHWKDGIR